MQTLKKTLRGIGSALGLVLLISLALAWNDISQAQTVNREQAATIEALQDKIQMAEEGANAALAIIDLNLQYLNIYYTIVSETQRDRVSVTEIAAMSQAIQEMTITYHRDGVTASLLLALIKRESSFDPGAVSEAGARGLMQVMTPTALTHQALVGYADWESESFDPMTNIRVGTAELVRLRRLWIRDGNETPGDSWTYTLHSYRWGRANTLMLMRTREKRVPVPSLEYSVGVRKIQLDYVSRGMDS